MGKIHLLMLALLSVFLVNLENNSAHSIQDSLPSLVLDDESTSSSPPASPSESSVTKKASSSDEENLDKEKTKEKDTNESRVIPYKTNEREESQQTLTTEQPKESSVESTKETTSQASSVAESTSTSKPAEETSTNKALEKDINVLLANKDDAENDLASPNSNSNSNSNSAPKSPIEPDAGQKPSVVMTSSEEKKQVELESPVDTNKQNDDRLHYSFGNPEPSKPSVEKKETPKEEAVGSEIAPEKPLEEKKGEEAENKPVEEKRDEAKADAGGPTGKRDQKEEEEEDEEKNEGYDKELDGKKDVSGEKPSKVDETPKQQASAPKTDSESSTKTLTSATEQTTTTTVSSISAETSSTEPPSSTTDTKSETVEKKEESPIVPKSEKPEGDGELKRKAPAEASTSVASTTAPVSSRSPSPSPSTSTTTTASTNVSSTKVPKTASVPSILAVALGTALGAAVNPIISNKSDKKPPPPVLVNSPSASSTITSTTTKAPSSTTKKSSTDRWDRWSTTPPSTVSTSTSGPARRRPILPSIRRRFRPYNRFSPFPWGGVDAYSPVGGDPDFLPADSPPKPPLSGTTNRPIRRRTGSAGEFTSSKPTILSGSPQSTNSDEDDGEDLESSNRRRQGNGNRRRHHHHHHHNRNNEENSEPGSQSVPKRKHLEHHHQHHHSHRHHDRDERPTVDVPSAFDSSFPSSSSQPRPISPGFGLFNTGSQAGPGFDLLNPFSGWFDDVNAGSRPQRPPSRAPPALSPTTSSSSSGRPVGHPRPQVAVEGEYDDNGHHEYGGRHDHHHHHGRPHNGRDEYDHDHHHHDCHEHDYDYHRDPYRPNRPHRDREPNRPPIGGYDDNYTPPGGYGRRPARPYNRRDQAEQDRNSNREREGSEASPSLYGGRVGALAPVAPRRVPSIFSPFDSLFGSIDDGLFSLRSSFIDSPLRAVGSDAVHTFDTIVSSPKISKQGVEQVFSAPSPLNNKESLGASSLDSDKAKEAKQSFSSLDSAENNTNGKATVPASNCTENPLKDPESDPSKSNDPYFSLVLTRSDDGGSLHAKTHTSCLDPRYNKGFLCQFLKLIHSLKEPLNMLI